MGLDLLNTFLYILFVLSAIVLVLVILLQEGKGGGFGAALGTAGTQTFGVKASGIHKFTAVVAIAFLGSAVAIHLVNRARASRTVAETGALPAIERTVDPSLDGERESLLHPPRLF